MTAIGLTVTADASIGRRGALAYGALGLPLAFAALPVYVHVPKLYADGLGVPLALVGAVLLATRIVDAVTDPLIGWFSDRVARRRLMLTAGLPLLALGLIALMVPPAGVGAGWLALAALVATLGYSIAAINYHAWGAELGRNADERTLLVAMREGLGLAGVVLAASLPALIGGEEPAALAWLAWIFVPLLAVGWLTTVLFAPEAPALARSGATPFGAFREALGHASLRRLMLVFAANGIAAAVPSATVLFFVADVLGAAHLAGVFLAIYFVAGGAGLPLWVALSRRVGKVAAWAASMVVAIVVFAWAATLGQGDLLAFGVICLLSGLALGADLALPPAMLADLLAEDPGETRGGAWFGLWNLINKTNLALAAGLALPLLSLLGYAPSAAHHEAALALAIVYGLVPVALKLLALCLLWRWRAHFRGDI